MSWPAGGRWGAGARSTDRCSLVSHNAAPASIAAWLPARRTMREGSRMRPDAAPRPARPYPL